jgi:hypothetical protein
MEIPAKDLYFLERTCERTRPSLDDGGAFGKKSHIAKDGLSPLASQSAYGPQGGHHQTGAASPFPHLTNYSENVELKRSARLR